MPSRKKILFYPVLPYSDFLKSPVNFIPHLSGLLTESFYLDKISSKKVLETSSFKNISLKEMKCFLILIPFK
jgi:hypothetical protein